MDRSISARAPHGVGSVVFAVLACIAALPACGDAEPAATTAKGTDGSAGADGTASLDSAAAAGDVAAVADGAETIAADVAPVADQSAAADGDEGGTSPLDAAAADGATKPDAPPSDTQKLMTCLFKNCADQIGECLGDQGCADAVGCLAGCKGDSGCMAGCGSGLPASAQQALLSVANCSIQQGCVQIIKMPNCGNGKCDFGEQLACAQDCGTASSICGDGKCDLGEMLSCDKDCKAQNPCGDSKCDGVLENPFTCPKDCPAPTCGDGKCGLPFETVLSCPKDCSATAACGDGACDPASETTLTCLLDCGGLACGDGKCSTPLETTFTCAKDCPVPKCGDAQCDAPWETGLTCSLDCSANGGTVVNVTGCVATKCFKESTTCVGDFTGCGAASLCLGGCKDMKCVVGCGAKLSGAPAQKFTALQDCIAKNCVAP